MLIIRCLLAILCAVPAVAAYRNLVAAEDGVTLVYSTGTGALARQLPPNGRPGGILTPETADISANGQVQAVTSYGERFCGFGGSTCFIAPHCSATLRISGPGIDVEGPRRRSFVRLDRAGRVAWIDQSTPCPAMPFTTPEQLNGLYELPSLKRIAPAGAAVLANQRPGRRLITDNGRALVFVGRQMHWLSAAGLREIRHVYGSDEAVTDAPGDNIVYVDAMPHGFLHWIEKGDDQPLNLRGSAPAISADGRTLLFLSDEEQLHVYDRATRETRRLASDTYVEFTIGGPAVFAVTSNNRLVRIDWTTGEVASIAEPFPEIDSIAAPPLPVAASCPLICYGTPAPWYVLGRSVLVVVEGRWLDLPGWRVRTADVDMPLIPMSATAAWFRVPLDIPRTGTTQTVEVYHPDHPLMMPFVAQIQDRAIACFGALHQDFSRIVTPFDPALPGEIVHIYLTGLHGGDPAQDGQPAPLDRLIWVNDAPPFWDPAAGETLFFGLAPGLIGLQQLDYRVLYPTGRPLFTDVNAYNCNAPPVANRMN